MSTDLMTKLLAGLYRLFLLSKAEDDILATKCDGNVLFATTKNCSMYECWINDETGCFHVRELTSRVDLKDLAVKNAWTESDIQYIEYGTRNPA